MRKISLIIIAALPLMWACTNDSDNATDSLEEAVESVEIIAGLNAATRTQLNGLSVEWEATDKISVNGAESKAAEIITSTTARFVVENAIGGTHYYCLYPSSIITPASLASKTEEEAGIYTVSFPATQNYVANGFASGINPSVGYRDNAWSNTTTTFYNLCGIAKITVTGRPNVRKVRFVATGANEYVSGDAVITVNSGSNATITMQNTANNYVDVDLLAATDLQAQSREVYFVLPPKTSYATGAEIQLIDNNGTVIASRISSGAINIARHTITDLGSINFPVTFAGSNIYWVSTGGTNGYLTFAGENDLSKQNYQGVFFNWGSLVGISPLDATFSLSTSAIYVPSSMDASTALWSQSTASAYGWTTVPYSYGATCIVSNVNYGDHLNFAFDSYTGDICRFITANNHAPAGSWRIPMMYEFGSTADYSAFTAGTISNANAAGTGTISAHVTKGGSVYFPASGRYYYTFGQQDIATAGYYWSSSKTSKYGYLMFNSTNIYTTTSDAPPYPEPVRCVKN